ncbi:hypothetical protein [Novosphingobium rosa]|uniref:hypothetical protein n=1 Tax=Novosphingobium rosa TaxID=76978 RepID=UPI001FE14D89|nr:hypothetical protein [Novosphingobium rosa]
MLGLFDQQGEQHQPQFITGEHLAATAATETIAPTTTAETTPERATKATPEAFAIGAVETAAEATGEATGEALAEAALHHHMHHAGSAAMAMSLAVSLRMAFMPFTIAAATSVKMPHHSFSCESCHEEKIRLTHDLSRYILNGF